MYECMYVCTQLCMHVCMYICMNACMYVCLTVRSPGKFCTHVVHIVLLTRLWTGCLGCLAHGVVSDELGHTSKGLQIKCMDRVISNSYI